MKRGSAYSEKTFQQNCRICGANNWSVLYKGPIRIGKFGNWSKTDYVVWKCGQCHVGFLDLPALDYEANDYREMVDGGSSREHHYAIHDGEQAAKVKILGTDKLRGKVIADIGCGAGSFLDLVKGFASNTIAVEPNRSFHQELESKGHKTYGYCKDSLKEWEGAVDIAVSFAVLEHVENPLEFLKEINSLLKPGGVLLISTPNYRDWLIEILPHYYGRFFFRYVHTWYFTQESIQTLSSLSGFSSTQIQFVQRFDISNALLWARDHRPTGLGKIQTLQGLDSAYKRLLEANGRSDFIYARLYV